MRIFAAVTLVLTLLATATPAGASDREITDLSDGALLGQIRSTQALQQAFDQRSAQLAQAGADIGLTPRQFQEVRQAIAEGRARYVELPQHIDAMSGRHEDRVFDVRNIRIPKGIYGWEVDLAEPDAVVKVYVPNRCGNLSLVRARRTQVLAAAPVYRELPSTAPAPPLSALIASAPPVYTPTAIAPVAYAPVVAMPAAAAAAPHLAILPLLLGGIVAGLLATGGRGGGVTVAARPQAPVVVAPQAPPAPPTVAAPTPAPQPTTPPVGCPTAVRRHP